MIYVLYDTNELPVIVADNLKDISVYLGRSNMNSMKVTLNKYFKRVNKGLEAHLEDEKGNHYTFYKYKE